MQYGRTWQQEFDADVRAADVPPMIHQGSSQSLQGEAATLGGLRTSELDWISQEDELLNGSQVLGPDSKVFIELYAVEGCKKHEH